MTVVNLVCVTGMAQGLFSQHLAKFEPGSCHTLHANSDILILHVVTNARGDASKSWLSQVMLYNFKIDDWSLSFFHLACLVAHDSLPSKAHPAGAWLCFIIAAVARVWHHGYMRPLGQSDFLLLTMLPPNTVRSLSPPHTSES